MQGSGAFFTSRVDLFQTSGGAKELLVTFTPRADQGGSPSPTAVPLPAGTQLEVTDPLAAWFGFGGDASTVGSLPAHRRRGRAGRGDDPPRPERGVRARRRRPRVRPGLPGAARDRRAGGRSGGLSERTVNAQVYRVNVGVMALVDGTAVTVTPQDPIGTPLAAGQSFTLDSGDNRQLNNIFNGLRPGPAGQHLVAVG